VLEAVPAAARGFVADAVGSGTTLLAARAPAELAPAYGAGSGDRHRASGATELVAPPGLRRDVDTPADLREALALGVGVRTAEVVARLPTGLAAGPFT
jgi:2-phospho-L-lactate guanylyltransferase